MLRQYPLQKILFALLLTLLPLECLSQTKTVYGLIRDKTTGKAIDISTVNVMIYAFNTVGVAQDVEKLMKDDTNTFVTSHSGQTSPDASGYYEITVPASGALIFKADMVDPVLEKVAGRTEINVVLEVGNRIVEAIITEGRSEVAVIDAQSEIVGNILSVSSAIVIPAYTGKTDARLIVQPVLQDRVTKDTLRYLRPMVIDGEEYTFTQDRRLDFNINNDPLAKYILPDVHLTDKKSIFPWSADIYLKEPNKEYLVTGLIQMEDYNKPYFFMQEYLASLRTRRPLRYLGYDTPVFDMNDDDYYVPPRREKMGTSGNISLSFEKAKAVIAKDDARGLAQIDSLRSILMTIVNDGSTTLQEFHIIGTASPEGSININTELSKKRTEYALQQIISVLPKYINDRVYSTATSNVCTWEDVAALMEADSLKEQSSVLRDIISQNPDRQDVQGKAILKLPFYQMIADRYLPQLRKVSYRIIYEVNRSLTPDEILSRWQNDKDYRTGRKALTMHEYWQLFRMVKDENELDTLYRMAYDETARSNGKPWVYAAGKLAASMLRKEIIDTNLLKPFIDMKLAKSNVVMTGLDGQTKEIVNPEAIICNQLSMFLKYSDFRRASQLAQMLPESEMSSYVKSLAMCLGGYYHGGKNPEERRRNDSYFQTVCQTSIWNKAVLCIARGHNESSYNEDALDAIAQMPDDEPMKYYFKAIVLGRKGYDTLMESEANLYRACIMKPELFEIAKGDGDIREDSVEEVRKALEDRETADLMYGYYF